MTLPLQSLHRGHRSTRNYLLAEESGTEERGNQLLVPGIAKLQVVDCCWVLWSISWPHTQLFQHGTTYFLGKGQDAEDEVVKGALAFSWWYRNLCVCIGEVSHEHQEIWSHSW